MQKPINNLLAHKNLLLIGAIYTVLITIAFLFPFSKPTIKTDVPLDKIVHILLSTGLSFLWLQSLQQRNGNGLSTFVTVFIIASCVLYGIIIEVLQKYSTTTRGADILDVVANCVGYLAGWLLFLKLHRLSKNKKEV